MRPLHLSSVTAHHGGVGGGPPPSAPGQSHQCPAGQDNTNVPESLGAERCGANGASWATLRAGRPGSPASRTHGWWAQGTQARCGDSSGELDAG